MMIVLWRKALVLVALNKYIYKMGDVTPSFKVNKTSYYGLRALDNVYTCIDRWMRI